MGKVVENNAEATPKPKKLGGCTGKGFKPGQSGNPGGRPKGLISAALARELRKTGQLAAVIAAIIAKAKKGDVQAFTAVRDTVDGKPSQAIVGPDGGVPIVRVLVEHIGTQNPPSA